ncbi:Hypothetical predicted protein, partial [Paramuricea clavata]
NDKTAITANITLGGGGKISLILNPTEPDTTVYSNAGQVSTFTVAAGTQNVTIVAEKASGSALAGILASFSNGIVTDDLWSCSKNSNDLKWEKASTYRRNDLNISRNRAISQIKQNAQWIWVKKLSASRVRCKRKLDTTKINLAIENENGNITKEITVKHKKGKRASFTLSENATFRIVILWENSDITIAFFHNDISKHEYWECTGGNMCTSARCDGSHLNWRKAYTCGSKIDWCSIFPPNLQWIWRSRLTSNIRCRKTT